MKYRLEISINKPRSEVWQAFRDPEKTKIWQPSLTGIQLVSGTPGQPGAMSKLTFSENKREYSLIERITCCQEPEGLGRSYQNQFASNTVQNTFLEQGENRTLWISETEYKFKTLLMKIIGPVYKKNLVARTRRDMESFKELVESG